MDGENFLEITAQRPEPALVKSMFGFLQIGEENVLSAKDVLNIVDRQRSVLGIGHDFQDRLVRVCDV